ncbi:hypothetical protein, partial [Arenibacter lacus]|uniref:hypothetical protein n=1 Tax=Arenibacter lacus TaxID=2608629 RepID=UPI001CC38720
SFLFHFIHNKSLKQIIDKRQNKQHAKRPQFKIVIPTSVLFFYPYVHILSGQQKHQESNKSIQGEEYHFSSFLGNTGQPIEIEHIIGLFY